jgi:DNA-binding NarL/FixJ family response regulator
MPPPKVLLYSAYADASLVIPSMLAGADGVVNKGAPANELYDAIRTVARGDRVVPPLSRELLDDANGRLHPDDLPILGMALDGTPEGEIARTLGLDAEEMQHRMDRMISTLKVEVPVSREA